jgi:hypothetical protein
MSNGTHLSNIAGDKQVWHVYMPIGNLTSKVHQMPSTHSVIQDTLLQIPIKNCNIAQKGLDEQGQTNREVLNDGHWWVLQPLTFNQNRSTESWYYNILFADGILRRCKSALAAWLRHCPEYSDLHCLEWHVYNWCDCPTNELGDYVPPNKQHPRWDHNVSRVLSEPITKADNAKLSSRHVHE